MWRLGAALLAVGSALGCTGTTLGGGSAFGPVTPALEPSTVDKSALCASVAERFVGLPDIDASESATALAPSVGRWWVRGCAAEPRGNEIEVRLKGPGWYWVDQGGNGLRVRQQVPFMLELVLRGSLHLESSERVMALWLEPSREPEVETKVLGSLDVRSENGWGAFVRVLPGVSPVRRATERFETTLSDAFRARLGSGATFTFNLRTGQADATVGRLAPGQTPLHPFSEDDEWIINDRLFLPPSSLQVLGPIEPGAVHLDVIVERGPGLSYRALCDDALDAGFAALQSGKLAEVPQAAASAAGTVSGLGERTTQLSVPRCKFYLVAATLADAPTLASVRVRPRA